jgi:hypothetical protein
VENEIGHSIMEAYSNRIPAMLHTIV